MYTLSVALPFFLVTYALGAPIILEGVITPKDSTVKIFKPSEGFIEELEKRLEVPKSQFFLTSHLKSTAQLNIEAVVGDGSGLEKAAVIAHSPDGSSSYLVAALGVPARVLEQLNTSSSTFLQVILPGGHHEHRIEAGDTAESPPVMVYPEPSPKEAAENFFQRFLELDFSQENEFIPDTVKEAMSSAQQVFVHPTAYLQVPEGQTGANDQIYTITSATPVELIFSLFKRVF